MATKNRAAADPQVCCAASTATNETTTTMTTMTSLDALKEQVSRLQAELEAERKLTKQLRREKSYELQKTRELEQTKASIALKDLRAKLHQERAREQEILKESLGRRHELDLQKVVRQKDAELAKLRADLRKCQDELEEQQQQMRGRRVVTCPNKCGLSDTSARGAFEGERQKLLSDIQELRSARRRLESELKSATEAERQRSQELQQLRSQMKVEMAKIRKESDTEIKRLLEELKSKDRLAWQKQREASTQTDPIAAATLPVDTPPLSPEVADLTNGVKEGAQTISQSEAPDRNNVDAKPLESKSPVKKDPGGVIQQKVKELTSRVKVLEDENLSLSEDKTQLQQKIKEMEKKHRTTLEKNKRFLEKNIEVTNINRSLEEKIKRLNDDLNKLRSQSEKYKREQNKLSEQLSSEKVEKQTLAELKCELEEMKEQAEQQEKTIIALKMACSEKDRRIELLVHKRRKQKNTKVQQKMVRFILPAKIQSMANGLKETYYGYDEDTMSIDSEMSSTSCLSSSHLSLDTSNEDDDVFVEVTRSDLEQSYQRLMKEHLELEKSYALLQAKAGASHTDPQRDNKDMCWLDEKETLTKTIRMLKDKIKSLEVHERRMTHRISEIQEQNEELEFRILELEELNEKLKEDVNDTITIKDPPQMTDEGVLQMYAEEKGLMEIKLDTLKERLHDLNYSKDGHLDKNDKLVLLQARAMLGIADKKLKDLMTTKELLKERIKKLEAEKAELLSAATGVSTDLILEYEETRKKLEEAEQRIKELEETMAKYKEAEAVYKYTEEQNLRLENKYKEEISSLQRQLSNSQEGREYESELWQEKLEKIKNYERRIKELEAECEPLKERVELLQIENSHLQCGLTQLQCENSRLQCENTELHTENTKLKQSAPDEPTSHWKSKVDEYEKELSEYKRKHMALEDELKSFKEKLEVAKKCEESLNTRIEELERELKDATDRCCHLENEVEKSRVALVNELRVIGHKLKEGEELKELDLYSGVQLLIKQVHNLMEENKVLQKKADDLNTINIKITGEIKEKSSQLEDLIMREKKHEELQTGLESEKVFTDGEDKLEADHKLLELRDKLERENRNLREKEDRLSKEKEDLIDEKNRLEAENRLLKEDNKRLDENNRKFEKERENLKDLEKRWKGVEADPKLIDQLRDETSRLVEENRNLEQEKNRLEEELEKLKELYENVKEDKNRMEMDADRLKEEKCKLEREKKMYEEDRRKLREEKKKLEESNEKLEEQRNKLKTQNEKLEEEMRRWMEEKNRLQMDNERLQEELEKSRKDAENQIIQLNAQSRTLIEKVKSLESKLKESQEGELQMKDRIVLMEEEKSRHIQHLQAQLEQMEENEATLCQTISELKAKEVALKEDISAKEQLLKDRMADVEVTKENGTERSRDRDELQEKMSFLERREAELLDAISRLEDENRTLKRDLDEIKTARAKSVQDQRRTTGLPVDTEKNIVEIEEQLRKEVDNGRKLIEDYKRMMSEYESQHEALQNDLNVANRRIETLSNEKEKSDSVIRELTDDKQATSAKMKELEHIEKELTRELADAKKVISERESDQKELQRELEQLKIANDELMTKVSELEVSEVALRAKLTSLESVKNDLLDTIQKSAQRSPDCSRQSPETVSDQNGAQRSSGDAGGTIANKDICSAPTDVNEIAKMPRDEMVARIRELEQLRASHLKKIKELSDNLSSFRQAVEVVAITLETDSDVPSQSCKTKLRDQDLEQRIRQLCKSELILNLKCMEQEKREAVLRLQLHEAEAMLKKQTKEYRATIQEIEEELDRVRKNEARLKNRLQYGGWNSDSHSLAKIQHLEELVFDLEANERRLRRQLQESQDNEDDLRRRLSLLEDASQPAPGTRDDDEHQPESGLLSEAAATVGAGSKLGPSSDPSELQKHISDVEKAERRLKLKLDQILIQEASTNFEEEQSPIPTDRPESMLRQKLQEMEVMQRHLKYEVVELERDRAELDEITHNDKSLIHELTVKVRQLEEMEKNLKEQLGAMEATDRSLNLKVEGLEEQLRSLQATENQLRLQLAKSESRQTTLGMQLEHAREDLEAAEAKYRQKLGELEKERRQLTDRANELTNELGDLHGIELSLKQKVRNMENTEVTLKNRVGELENALKLSKRRIEELEALNETISQKMHKLEEEKSSMMFEMSDLVVNSKKAKELQDRLKSLEAENKLLKDAAQHEHEEELAKLRKEINRLSSLSKAHEVLKSNHEDMKRQLKEMEEQLQKQNARVTERPVTKAKGIQVKLSDSYSIHDLEPVKCLWCLEYDPEFRTALRNLGTRHPEAYHEFVKALQPQEGRSHSVVRVTGQSVSPTAHPSSPPPPSGDPHHRNAKPRMANGEIAEDVVVPKRRAAEKTSANGTAKAQIEKAKKNIDPVLRKHYIGQLVDALLLADDPLWKQHSEDPLWKVVETADPEEGEKPYWAEVEVRPVDVMTVSLDVWGLTTDESSSEASSAVHHPKVLPSDAPSMASDTSLPPLPASIPPTNKPRNSSIESYYLPDGDGSQAGDSADEAPDIVDEDDGLRPLKDAPRAKSAERDSDFSEESFLRGSLHRRKRQQHRLAGSLESIQDSGTGSLKEDYVIKTMKERIAELEAKLQQNEDQSSSLRSKDILITDCTNLKKDNLHLKALVDEKAKELALKTKEIERLTGELKRLQTNLASTQHNNVVEKKSLKVAEDQLNKLKETEKAYVQLQQKYGQLQSEHEELKERFMGLKEASEEVVNKKKLITELQTKLSNYNKLKLELQSSEKKVKALEEKLKDMSRIETSITRQNVKLLHDVDSLQQRVTHYHVMQEQYNRLRSKFDEAVQLRSKALTMIAPLRAKVMRFASKCKSKDEVIRHLLMDIRRCGKHNELATKAEKVVNSSVSEDYDRPISPFTLQMIQGYERDLKEKDLGIFADVNNGLSESVARPCSVTSPPGQNSRLRNLEALLDHDVKCSDGGNNRQQHFQRSLSTDNLYKPPGGDQSAADDVAAAPPQLSLPPVVQLDSAARYLSSTPPMSDHNVEPSSQKPSQSSAPSKPATFIAVNNYNPELFSTSGQKELELPLREGDLVKVIGPKNGQGYYEAEVKGRVGLVPALYLVPAPRSQSSNQKTESIQPNSDLVNSSPEEILAMYADLACSHKPSYSAPSMSSSAEMGIPSRKPNGTGSNSLVHPAFTKSPAIIPKTPLSPTRVAHPAYHHGNQSPGLPTASSSSPCCPPDPPSDFHVQRTVGDHSVLLSWQPPVMDEFARSNGITIKGYKIYINNKDVQFVPSAHMSKAFIENLQSHHGTTTFSIQSIGENGQSSRLVDSICIDSTTGDEPAEADYGQDTSSLKSSRHSESGEKKRMCYAVYDYEPSKQSANPCPSQELALKAGDVVITYGSEQEDGFYYGKVHGKKGLVPASFIEEVPVFTCKLRRSLSSNASQMSSLLSPAGSIAGSSHSSTATSNRSRPLSNHSNHSTSSSGSRARLGRRFEAVV